MFKVYAYRRLLLVQALRDHRGNKSAVSRELGISRTHIDLLMERFGLQVESFQGVLERS